MGIQKLISQMRLMILLVCATPLYANQEECMNIADEAYGLKSSGHIEGAIVKYQEVLKECPDFDAADTILYGLGEIYADLKEDEVAIETFRELINRYPDSENSNQAVEYLKSLDASIEGIATDGRRALVSRNIEDHRQEKEQAKKAREFAIRREEINKNTSMIRRKYNIRTSTSPEKRTLVR